MLGRTHYYFANLGTAITVQRREEEGHFKRKKESRGDEKGAKECRRKARERIKEQMWQKRKLVTWQKVEVGKIEMEVPEDKAKVPKYEVKVPDDEVTIQVAKEVKLKSS